MTDRTKNIELYSRFYIYPLKIPYGMRILSSQSLLFSRLTISQKSVIPSLSCLVNPKLYSVHYLTSQMKNVLTISPTRFLIHPPLSKIL